MTQAAPPRDEIGADDPELPKGDRAITPVPGRLGAGKGKAIILAALIVGLTLYFIFYEISTSL